MAQSPQGLITTSEGALRDCLSVTLMMDKSSMSNCVLCYYLALSNRYRFDGFPRSSFISERVIQRLSKSRNVVPAARSSSTSTSRSKIVLEFLITFKSMIKSTFLTRTPHPRLSVFNSHVCISSF